MSNIETSSESTLPPCEICHKTTAIYCCPRCSIRTCSLACCKSHKVKKSNNGGGENNENNGDSPEVEICNGKRDRTKFCSLKQFSDSQLSSDYHFLEDVLKVSESSKRLYQGITTGNSSSTPGLGAGGAKRARVDMKILNGKEGLDSITDKPPVHPLLKAKEGKTIAQVLANGVSELENEDDTSGKSPSCISAIQKKLGEQSIISPSKKPAPVPPPRMKSNNADPLARQAEIKGIHLLRMPSGMERRKSNTTKFNKKSGAITWKIELCFHPSSKHANENDIDKSLPKMLKVESQMSETSTLSEELGKHLDVHPGNSAIRSQLRSFANVPRNNLVLLMKKLPCSSAAPQYFRLDGEASFSNCLSGKTIIEFPTVDVIFEEDEGKYPLFIGEVL